MTVCLLMRKINFIKLFDINPNDTDLYHMQGMLLRRRINALSKMFQRDLQTKDFEEIDIRGIRDCLEDWVQQSL